MVDNAMIQSVLDYFGSDSSIYRKIVLGQATDAEISYAFTQIPRMQADISAAGTTLGYSYADPVYIVPAGADDIVSSFDSNAAGGGYGSGAYANYPISLERDAQTGQAYINAGASGAGSTLMAVADRVALGVIGVNVGCKLGKAIDEALYNVDPDWWDTHYPSINPDTWPTLVGENEAGQAFFRTLFNIDDNGDVTAYVDERVLAQTYQTLRDSGVWATGDKEATYTGSTAQFPNPDITSFPVCTSFSVLNTTNQVISTYTVVGHGYFVLRDVSGVLFQATLYTDTLGTYYRVVGTDGYSYEGTPASTLSGRTYNNTPFAPAGTISFSYSNRTLLDGPIAFPQGSTTPSEQQITTVIFDGTIVETSPIEGVSNIDGATQYPPTNITGTTLNDVLTELKTEYPDLFANPITENVVQPDGTVSTRTYVPVPWQTTNPTDKTQGSPITTEDPVTSTTIDPDIAPDIITQTQPSSLDDTTTPPPDTPDTGSGSSDPIVTPTGGASSLWAIYNPTQAELNSFGGWLWSSDFVDQLKKLFNDPMQAIIGVHKVFASPATGAAQTIKCGYLDSGVSSKIVTSQYSDVDCGSVNLREYYGNVFDYAPYTSVKIFLPFIGIVPLDVSYIMRSTISVKYTVDVLTGACLATISVTRDGGGGVIFTYGGSAIVSYPVSSGSYMGIVSGALSLLAGIAGTVASGGAALPAAIGAAAGLPRMHTQVNHSGQFSGAAGAMGGKTPYLIISRPQTRVADDVEAYQGKPANATLTLGECTGYTRVIEAHLSIPRAYAADVTEIIGLLQGGVII